MKITSRILSVILGLAMIAGSAVAVSADDDVAPIADTTETTPVETTAEDEADLINEEDEDVALVFVDIEGAEGNIALTSGTFAKDGTVTVADVLKAIDEADDTLEITGIDEGYITTVNGLTAGTFGGYDGWMYAVKYYTPLRTALSVCPSTFRWSASAITRSKTAALSFFTTAITAFRSQRPMSTRTA